MDFSLLLILIILSAGLNVLVFAAFTLDKLNAKVNRLRTPEITLLLLAALGPFGALTAMVGFRHKTRHGKFFLVPVFVILQLLLFVWLWLHLAGK